MHSRWLEHYNFGYDAVLFGTISWRRTRESLRVAFPHVSHRFTFVLAFWEAVWSVVFGFVCFGLCFVFVLF